MINDVVSCASSSWVLRLGDQTLVGWIITLAYVALVFVVFKLIKNIAASQDYDRRRLLGFWAVVLLIYVGLGLNKQLDLQTSITATGRCVSRVQGWYQERRDFQLTAMAAGLGVVVVLLFGFLVYFRTIISRSWLAILGVACSLAFVVLRAASFHHVDQVFRMEFMNIRAHAFMEMAGIMLVFANVMTLAWGMKNRRYG